MLGVLSIVTVLSAVSCAALVAGSPKSVQAALSTRSPEQRIST
jgi:hypothetical protein